MMEKLFGWVRGLRARAQREEARISAFETAVARLHESADRVVQQTASAEQTIIQYGDRRVRAITVRQR